MYSTTLQIILLIDVLYICGKLMKNILNFFPGFEDKEYN